MFNTWKRQKPDPRPIQLLLKILQMGTRCACETQMPLTATTSKSGKISQVLHNSTF